jgi:GNAT superfamily N-acetyltransferase
MSTEIAFRRAARDQSAALRELHACSLRALGSGFYESDVIEAFLAHIDTLDERLIDEGTYFTVLVDGVLAGCGGWTGSEPSYASHLNGDSPHDTHGRATVRSVYVHPDYVRLGIARQLMNLIETNIAQAGFASAALEATLNGIPFYRRLGYRGGAPAVFRLPRGLLFVGLSMEKPVIFRGRR